MLPAAASPAIKVVEISKKFDAEFPQDSDTCGTAARRE
jgi:hypothetical protein